MFSVTSLFSILILVMLGLAVHIPGQFVAVASASFDQWTPAIIGITVVTLTTLVRKLLVYLLFKTIKCSKDHRLNIPMSAFDGRNEGLMYLNPEFGCT